MNAVTPLRETLTTRFWRELTIAMGLLDRPAPTLADAQFCASMGMSVAEAAVHLSGLGESAEIPQAIARQALDELRCLVRDFDHNGPLDEINMAPARAVLTKWGEILAERVTNQARVS